MSNEDQPVQVPFSPWYKEPWAWYILSILIISLGWVSFQVYTAFSVEDSVVVDDYYKSGKAINQDLSREQQAFLSAITAHITFDEHTGEVHTIIQGNIERWPTKLMLRLSSPAFASDDQIIPLSLAPSKPSTNTDQNGATYLGQLHNQAIGRYYIQLETYNTEAFGDQGVSGWKISSSGTIQTSAPVMLEAAAPETLNQS